MTKRYSRGLQFLAAYTFGKSTDYYSGGHDRRHRFVTNFVPDHE